jgi:hypothetical protein
VHVLVAIYLSEFPCQATVCRFPADLMNNVMMGLFQSVIDVLKDCNKAELSVTTFLMVPLAMLWDVAMASVTITIARMPPSLLQYRLILRGWPGVACAPRMQEV